jgi:hypothetical protein
MINPIDRETLRAKVRSAVPFPSVCLDNFLREEDAARISDAFPAFETATAMGKTFSSVNEKRKVQVVDSRTFAPPVAALNSVLASAEFRDLLSYAFDIPELLADEKLVGGGLHQTGARGRLDVHVDFNYIEERALHRRLNILIYLNKVWRPEWGGNVELWDREVKVCHHSFSPVFNRCVIFETSDISFHGVTPVTCPDNVSRKSFAAYYYTKQAPAHWQGKNHSTIFRARPDEKFRGIVLMPAEHAARWTRHVLHQAKGAIKTLLKG